MKLPSTSALKPLALATLLATFGPHLSAASVANSPLSSDWESQALATNGGFKVDFRYDTNNQTQTRSGTSAVATWPVSGYEQELQTLNQTYTLGLDYSENAHWGLNVQLPYIARTHSTNGYNFDGTDAGATQKEGLGDMKVVARLQGVLVQQTLGLQVGLKLPTGSTTQVYDTGAIAGQPLARSLQLGTGTTDTILGLYSFGNLPGKFDYFAQALYQRANSASLGYRPGDAVNANLGFRYLGFDSIIPMFQFNAQWLDRDSGVNADAANTGSQTLYLSPGFSVPIASYFNAYLFWQLPVYQNYYGYQLAPRSIVTVGGRFNF